MVPFSQLLMALFFSIGIFLSFDVTAFSSFNVLTGPEDPPTREGPRVIKELKQAGIDVIVTPPPEEGDPDFLRKYNGFIKLLTKYKQEVIKRKAFFQQLDITYFNHLDSFNKILSLNVSCSEDLLKGYFKLFDLRTQFEKETKILLDLGIEVYSNNQGLEYFEKSLREILSFQTALMAKKSLLSRIFVDEYYSYKVGDKFLFVDRANLPAQLADFVNQGKMISVFVEFADSIGLYLSGDLDFAIKPIEFSRITNQLLEIKQEIEFLVKTKALGELEINFSRSYPVYNDRQNILTIYNSDDSTVNAIKALSMQKALQISWNKVIKNSFFKFLDPQYVQTVERIQKFKSLIETKLNKFNSVVISDRSFFDGTNLFIGLKESEDEFEKIISQL